MKEVSFEKYQEDLLAFINKHNKYDYEINTRELDNGYEKMYMFEDGSTFYEVNKRVKEWCIINKHNIKQAVQVEYFVTEYWSTDDSVSKYVYQRV